MGQELAQLGFNKMPSHIGFKRVSMDIIRAMFSRTKMPKNEKAGRESIVRSILLNKGLAMSAASGGSSTASFTEHKH